MAFLENKIPPPLVLLIVLIAMTIGAHFDQTRLLKVDIAYWNAGTALLIGLAGTLVAISGVISFRKAQTTVNPLQPEKASRLVVNGVFRFSRNPMYLGMALVCIAWVIYLASPWCLFGVLAFVLFITRFQIIPEERAMRRLFGDQFARYQAETRRWI